MTEKQARIKEIREKLANITPELKAELTSRGLIATVEGRTLSLHNTFMVYIQSNGTRPSVVGGYKQWKTAGRQVSKGQHGYSILFPVGDKDKASGDILEATRFYSGTVFDISQTEEIGVVQTEPALISAPAAKPQPVAYNQADKNIMEGWELV